MTLSMPKTRKEIRKQEAVADQLRHGLAARGVKLRPKQSKRDALIEAAKSGRPSNLREQALEALRARRVQRDIDLIAGRVP